MSDEQEDRGPVELLTEPEVAHMLRCSTSKIKRLRLSGKLAYLPGRPLYVEYQAVIDYINAARVPAKYKAVDPTTPSGNAEMERRSREEARAWAIRKVAIDRIRGR
ncbi:MAG: DNA-binding protein [Rhizobiales bacterium]|mgnify:CR=1 FL=1|nr:DNA-binding protein [Hyphomicrobiales bacterium]|tara:strand:- start:7514 stop:7831 length:318 start_codon:yes stop_codon:yes gene_type:complete